MRVSSSSPGCRGDAARGKLEGRVDEVRLAKAWRLETCTASLRLEKTKNKNMHSHNVPLTYHYYANVPLPLFCVFKRGMFSLHCRFCIAANVFAALPLFRGIAANVVFRGIFAALPLLFWMFFFAFLEQIFRGNCATYR